MKADKLILGVDPGREKTGLALVTAEGQLITATVVATDELESAVAALTDRVDRLVLGDGTNSSKVAAMLARVAPKLPLTVVNEKHSTEEAKVLYWQMNPPKGLKRLVPLGLLNPPGAMDGYAAAVIAQRFLNKA